MKDAVFSYNNNSNVYADLNTAKWWKMAEYNLYHKNKKVKNDEANHAEERIYLILFTLVAVTSFTNLS